MDTIQNESEPNEQRKGLKKLEQQYEKKIQELLSLAEQVQEYKQNVLSSLSKLEKLIFQKTSLLVEMKNKISYFKAEQQEDIYQQENKLNYMLIEINDNISNKLKDLESFTKLEKLYQSLNNFKSDEIQTIDIDLSYQLISSQTQQQYSFCMNFNRNGTMLIAANSKMIKVFEINEYKLKEVLQLNSHISEVLCLKFLNKSDSFISSSQDGTVIFWEKLQLFSWKSIQILTNQNINRIIINSSDDLFIFATKTNQIGFWHKNNKTWSCNQLIDCESYIFSISLNSSEDKLIADVYEKQILIIQFHDQEWKIFQKIPLELFGCGLCSINLNQFVFKPYNMKHLQVFEYDSQEKQFKEGQKVQYSDEENDGSESFPIRYISSIGLLIVKNNSSVHIIKSCQSGQFSMQYNTIYGGISNDGRFIATWDKHSSEIQLRILEY